MAEKPKNIKQVKWIQEVSPDGSIVNRPSYEAYTFKPPPSEIIEARVKSSLISDTTISSSYATTSSYALTAQTLLGTVVSASYALTASFIDGGSF